ncbi:serine hydrolase domain-containing protein [Mycobacterium aquaticum]|uniref:Beta-lactamase-related domain-containing protein n=1 Tax=Mycobacterium aquaticum TaxID=1927124 RepID=A0A1X0BBP9_9MYCO|nr:serine hydrolase domain-containing protein [Mycobacterium aquaticum]ORA39246.1 hypothetical protein BST13_02995 [Mycobacterium aquaticum]
MMPTAPIHGHVDPGFENVRAAFAANFERGTETGAAYAVTINGRLAVDLWGGLADPATGRRWGPDTTQVIFSGTKALVAVCLLMLVDRGLLDLESPVAHYWPEFAANGKERISVSDLASHQARLPGLRANVTHDDLVDGAKMANLLAAQPCDRDPRARHTYHPLTYGWLCGELIRRVDGRTVGRFFADEVARPLGLRLWIGLPDDQLESVARLSYASTWGSRLSTVGDGSRKTDRLQDRVWNNPPLFPADEIPANRTSWHRAEIPGIGAIGTARSIARLYGCLANSGQLDGIRLLTAKTLHEGLRLRSRRQDPLINELMAFGIGFRLATESREFGPALGAFGHPGAGGSTSCAWPSHRAGLSYATNTLRDDQPNDARAHALIAATHHALERQECCTHTL